MQGGSFCSGIGNAVHTFERDDTHEKSSKCADTVGYDAVAVRIRICGKNTDRDLATKKVTICNLIIQINRYTPSSYLTVPISLWTRSLCLIKKTMLRMRTAHPDNRIFNKTLDKQHGI